MARPVAQAISKEKFRGTDQSAKTTKLFYLKQFAIYSILSKLNDGIQVNSVRDIYVTLDWVNSKRIKLVLVYSCLN